MDKHGCELDQEKEGSMQMCGQKEDAQKRQSKCVAPLIGGGSFTAEDEEECCGHIGKLADCTTGGMQCTELAIGAMAKTSDDIKAILESWAEACPGKMKSLKEIEALLEEDVTDPVPDGSQVRAGPLEALILLGVLLATLVH